VIMEGGLTVDPPLHYYPAHPHFPYTLLKTSFFAKSAKDFGAFTGPRPQKYPIKIV
jgi:hypothetical protein